MKEFSLEEKSYQPYEQENKCSNQFREHIVMCILFSPEKTQTCLSVSRISFTSLTSDIF